MAMSSTKTTNILLTCVLLAALAFLALALSGGEEEETPAPTAQDEYRLEKINEVNDMVIQRQVVPEGYFRYLGEELAAAVEEYNSMTAGMHCNYARYGNGIAETFFYETKEDPGDYDRPILYYEWISSISRLALHKNSYEMLLNDDYLVALAYQELGGSGGLWFYFVQNDAIGSQELTSEFEEYFAMIDALMPMFDEARAQLN